MSNSVLKELKKHLDDFQKDKEMPLEDLIAFLKELPQYKRTPVNVLRINIEKLQSQKSSMSSKEKESDLTLSKKQALDDPQGSSGGLIKQLKFDNYPIVSFHQLGGMAAPKALAEQYIKINLQHRHMYSLLGLTSSPKHLLINGPQGTGKSTLALAICNEAKLNFLKLTLYDPRIYSSLNDGRMSAFLKSAKASTPCVLIIDDLDSFFTGESATKENERKTLNNLLNFFDEIEELDIFVIGIVTKIEKLHSALMRSGRFETRIDMKIPDECERECILKHLVAEIKVAALDFKELSLATAGFVPSDLKSLVVKAAELSIKEALQSHGHHQMNKNRDKDQPSITHSNFVENGEQKLATSADHMQIETEEKVNAPTQTQSQSKINGASDLEAQSKEFLIKQCHFTNAVPLIMPIIKKEGFTSIPLTTWDDIGALQSLKAELEKLIIKPIQNPEICSKFSIRRQAGVLLYGPPGCGKTMLAKAVANACRANFIYVKGPELLSKYVGESEKAVRGLFERAKLSAPCLIFFDEIDGLCPKRGTDGNQVIERVVNQLLTEMNGVEELNQIYIIGATNRPDIIDRAILRPERLGVHLYVPLPNTSDQADILKTILQKKPLDQSVQINQILSQFDFNNFSGADLNAFVEAAARNAAWTQSSRDCICMEDFEMAYKNAKPSITPADVTYYKELFKRFR